MKFPLIDWYPLITDDAVALVDNDSGGSISVIMVFVLHPVAVDDECNNIYCSYHILSSTSLDIMPCGNNSCYSYIF